MDVQARRELINAYLDGELSTEQALLVSRWLDSNPGALREVEHLRHLWDLLENYEDEPVPEEFAAGVMQAAGVVPAAGVKRVGAAAPAGRLLPMAWYRRPLATAAAVLVAIGATAFFMAGPAPETLLLEQGHTGETVASASRLEALGVEDLESLEFLDVIADADDDTFDALVADGLGADGHMAGADATGSGRGG